jgi:hypothetical protein
MVNWHSPEVITEDEFIFLKFIHVLLGLYAWEWLSSLDFDWEYLTGRKKFRWPMAFYFLNRYCLLLSLIGITISFNVTTKVDCQSLYLFNQVTGNMALGLVSINLSIRTMVVWSLKWYIVIPLVAIILGHWSLLLHGLLLRAEWDPSTGGCIITETNPSILSATFIYSMCLDFIVLCLTGFKLHYTSANRSQIGTLIFTDGLVYFIVAFIANVIAVTFLLLNLNPVMSIIATVPAAIASTTVTCRAVRRLANFPLRGSDPYQGTHTRTTISSLTVVSTPQANTIGTKQSGMEIQLETF